MRLRVLNCAAGWVDVDLLLVLSDSGTYILLEQGYLVNVTYLSTRYNGAHAQRIMPAGEGRDVSLRAVVSDAGRAVAGCVFADPEGEVGGVDFLVVDGRRGANGDEAEVLLSVGQAEESSSCGEGGLHLEMLFVLRGMVCEWLNRYEFSCIDL